jgi:hypothetical protein
MTLDNNSVILQNNTDSDKQSKQTQITSKQYNNYYLQDFSMTGFDNDNEIQITYKRNWSCISLHICNSNYCQNMKNFTRFWKHN